MSGCIADSLQMIATSVKHCRSSPFGTGCVASAAVPRVSLASATFPLRRVKIAEMLVSSKLSANTRRPLASAQL